MLGEEVRAVRSGSEAMHEQASQEKSIRFTASLENDHQTPSSEKATPSEQSRKW